MVPNTTYNITQHTVTQNNITFKKLEIIFVKSEILANFYIAS